MKSVNGPDFPVRLQHFSAREIWYKLYQYDICPLQKKTQKRTNNRTFYKYKKSEKLTQKQKVKLTALFTNMRTLKFKRCLHNSVFRRRQS